MAAIVLLYDSKSVFSQRTRLAEMRDKENVENAGKVITNVHNKRFHFTQTIKD